MSKNKNRLPKVRNVHAELLAERTGNFRGPHKDKKNKGGRRYNDIIEIENQLSEYEEELEEELDF